MLDCAVRDARIECHRVSCVYFNQSHYAAVGTGCAPLAQCLSQLSLPPFVGRVSAFGLSNNKWRWWMWTTAACWRTHSPSRLAWSRGRCSQPAVRNSSMGFYFLL